MTSDLVMIDSSAIIGMLSEDDALHGQAVSALNKIKIGDQRIAICDVVAAETLTRVKQKWGASMAYRFQHVFSEWQGNSSFLFLWMHEEIFRSALDIFAAHPSPKTFSFIDAVLVAHMQSQHIPLLFTFDRDFQKLGIKTIP